MRRDFFSSHFLYINSPLMYFFNLFTFFPNFSAELLLLILAFNSDRISESKHKGLITGGLMLGLLISFVRMWDLIGYDSSTYLNIANIISFSMFSFGVLLLIEEDNDDLDLSYLPSAAFIASIAAAVLGYMEMFPMAYLIINLTMLFVIFQLAFPKRPEALEFIKYGKIISVLISLLHLLFPDFYSTLYQDLGGNILISLFLNAIRSLGTMGHILFMIGAGLLLSVGTKIDERFSLKKFSVFLCVLFSIITLGLYNIFWLVSKWTKTRYYASTIPFYILIFFYSMYRSATSFFGMHVKEMNLLISSWMQFVYIIIFLVFCYRLARQIEKDYPGKVFFNNFFIFIVNIFHIQHIINLQVPEESSTDEEGLNIEDHLVED